MEVPPGARRGHREGRVTLRREAFGGVEPAQLASMKLYVVRITQRDGVGEPCDCYVVAGPYRSDTGGNAEANDAAEVLQLRHPSEEYRVMGFLNGLELPM